MFHNKIIIQILLNLDNRQLLQLASQFKMDSSDDEKDKATTLSQKCNWEIIEAYFRSNSIVQQQLDSFNQFAENIIRIILEYGKIDFTLTPQFKLGSQFQAEQAWNFSFVGPVKKEICPMINTDGSHEKMIPMMCRLRQFTYQCQIKCDLEYKCEITDIDSKMVTKRKGIVPNISIAKIPVMVGSDWCILNKKDEEQLVDYGECIYDKGGYFIIKGSQKVIVGQQKRAQNSIIVLNTNIQNEPWIAQIRSCSSQLGSTPSLFKLIIKLDKGTPRLLCRHNFLSKDIPFGIIMRAFGLNTDKEIFECVCQTQMRTQDHIDDDYAGMLEILRNTLQQLTFYNQEDCLNCLGRFINTAEMKAYNFSNQKYIFEAKKLLQYKFFPHIGLQVNIFRKKAIFLGYMARKLIFAYLKKSMQDDRQNFGKKRVELTGDILLQLFSHEFKINYLRQAKIVLLKKIQDKKCNLQKKMQFIFDERIISNSIKKCLATGRWKKNMFVDINRTGVSQVLKRDTTYFSSLSHLRRINHQIASGSKIIKPRLLHNTHFGLICPTQTPQGQKIGLVKNLSLLTKVTQSIGEQQIQNLMTIIKRSPNAKIYDIYADLLYKGNAKILLDGNYIAFATNAMQFVKQIKSCRKKGVIPSSISINRNYIDNQIRIYTDGGRLIRPLLIVQNNQILLKPYHIKLCKQFDSFIKKGLIQWLDVQEEENSLIAIDSSYMKRTNLNYSHCEIHPSMIFGVCASLIPFSNHNQVTKNTLQSAMSKQAMGISGTNFNQRFQTINHLLYYPQRPLVTTKSSKFTSAQHLPFGQNVIVAMSCFTGYNQQDSIIINQSSIQRGLFRSAYYRCYMTSQRSSNYTKIKSKIMKNPKSQIIQTETSLKDYKIGQDGIINIGSHIDGCQKLVSKFKIADSYLSNHLNIDQSSNCNFSLYSKNEERGIVDKVMISENSQAAKIVRLKIRSIRIPQIGDKFASRHGQKGTCGMGFRQQDLPFTINGIVPDLIINPHCIPSRMTIGHLIQCLAAKIAAVKGIFSQDGTAFNDFNLEQKAKELHSYKLQKYGNQKMTNPYTGNQMQNQIFIGPIYYQRLRHLVEDKVYARSRGRITALTRQPTHGRKKQGGLRFGEMQRDCVIAHGMSDFLRQRLFLVSDYFKVNICSKCGLFAIKNIQKGLMYCNNCKKKSQIFEIQIPYASKLMIQELISMHIVPKLFFLHIKNKIT